LDGETNMKMKNCHKELQKCFRNENAVTKLDGVISCEKPNKAIYKFEGTMDIPQINETLSLGAENLLLRGSSVRNTEYVYGVAVFCGHDTKVMQNSEKAEYKPSRLDKATNIAILIVLLT
jgi:magnesium-transporting ATPase (P-type)